MVVFVSTTSALIYKSFEYEVPVFWNGNFHSFTVSSFHENITDRVKVDSLAVFCFGDAVCLWEDINMVGNGEMIVLDKSGCNQCIMRLNSDAKSCDLKGKNSMNWVIEHISCSQIQSKGRSGGKGTSG